MNNHTPTPWKWHPKDEPNDRNGSVYSEQMQGHAYAVAMQPKYAGNVQWSEDAALIVRAVNSYHALMEALQPFLALADAVFEKYEVRPGEFREANSHKSDSQVWSYNFTPITYDDLRRVRTALREAAKCG